MPEPFYRGTQIAEPPTFTGRAGSAWRTRQLPMGQRTKPDHDATVGVFVVRVPGAHILWDHWLVSMIHLRDITGVPPAHRTFPSATHEFMILALDPGEPLPSLDVTADWHPRTLRPVDVLEQLELADDVVADEVLELAVQAITAGSISPDQDFRTAWKEALVLTQKHYAQGKHVIPRQ